MQSSGVPSKAKPQASHHHPPASQPADPVWPFFLLRGVILAYRTQQHSSVYLPACDADLAFALRCAWPPTQIFAGRGRCVLSLVTTRSALLVVVVVVVVLLLIQTPQRPTDFGIAQGERTRQRAGERTSAIRKYEYGRRVLE